MLIRSLLFSLPRLESRHGLYLAMDAYFGGRVLCLKDRAKSRNVLFIIVLLSSCRGSFLGRQKDHRLIYLFVAGAVRIFQLWHPLHPCVPSSMVFAGRRVSSIGGRVAFALCSQPNRTNHLPQAISARKACFLFASKDMTPPNPQRKGVSGLVAHSRT